MIPNSDDSSIPPLTSVVESNQLRNRSTRQAGEFFSAHRKISTELVLAGIDETSKKLCVFGAGNSNDLDIDQLIRQYELIYLIDVDAEALELSRVKYQQAATAHGRNITVETLVFDLTGVCDVTDNPTTNEFPLEELVQKSQKHTLPIPLADFDCVVSTCILSQIVGWLHIKYGASSEFLSLVLEVRRKHFELMIQHLRSGGLAVFISDFVSSVTWPQLSLLTQQQLNDSVMDVIQQGNFFTGCNPLAIVGMLREDRSLATNIDRIQLSPCWCWNLGTQQMAVVGISFRRRAA
jgi:hypothetical protein